MGSLHFNPGIGAASGETVSTEPHIRDLVAKALKRCSRFKDRQQVALELNTLAGLGVTKNMLDDWASPSKKGLRFPASLVKAFCEVTGDDSLQRYVMGERLNRHCQVGAMVLDSRDMWEALAPALARAWRRRFREESKHKRARKGKRTRKA